MTYDIEAARQYYRARDVRRRALRESEREQWLQRVREVIAYLAPRFPGLRRLYLFGSLTQSGRFRTDSDIDLAVECDTPETESALWRALERELGRDVDLRPFAGALADLVADGGELLYGRQDTRADQ